MKFKKGMVLGDKKTGRLILIKSKASGNKHWNCVCGRKNHKIHEGTLLKFYEVIND